MSEEVKLQYSVLCERDEKYILRNLLHGFTPGFTQEFYVVNKWVWDGGQAEDSGYYQVTEIIWNNQVLVSSQSDIFTVKLSHTHHNLFKDVYFDERGEYRIRVALYDSRGREVSQGSLEYPVFVREEAGL